MDSKPAQNIQDTFLNTVRKDKSPITIYLVSGVKLTGKIRSFDKYSVLLENNAQEQLIFKHAISTVVSGRLSAFDSPRESAADDSRFRWIAWERPTRSRCQSLLMAAVPLKQPVRTSRANATRQSKMLLRQRQAANRELAVLVAVEFTSDRFQPSSVAQQARAAAAITADDATKVLAGEDIPKAVVEPVADVDFDASLAEFQELARSAGATIAAVLIQRRGRPDPATLVGGGKLDEIVATVASTGASLVLFDHDLTPSQARNVEARLPCTVIDRTQLILDIFARHARTREGSCRWSWRSWSISCRG